MNKVIFNKLIVYVAVVISLIFTPFNFDALIIPKVILLFVLVLYLLPVIFLNIRFYVKDRQLLFLFIVSVLILLQMLLVMIISKAPFAQEFYGRTGRGLGIATFFSVLVLLLCMATYSQLDDSYFIIKFLVICCVDFLLCNCKLVLVYLYLQHFVNIFVFFYPSFHICIFEQLALFVQVRSSYKI